jgi:threonine dehydrogenase-like Zn-dependent dehydrogenase
VKQILQNYKTGELLLTDVPAPVPSPGRIIVKNKFSLVSAGTERQMIDLARKSLLGKARARPDLVKKVIAVIKTEGIKEAYQASKSRLETPIPLGYSSAGKVIGVGQGVESINIGDRVACAGSNYASHAEIISMPTTLCVSIPDKGKTQQIFGHGIKRSICHYL